MKKQMECLTATYESPIGHIVIAENDGALTGLWFEGAAHFGSHFKLVPAEELTATLQSARAWLEAWFGRSPLPALPELKLVGTDFQKAVWQSIAAIPRGEVTTYGALAAEVARRLGRPRCSARAVGQATGRNPLSIIVPCHRVVGTGGGLTGYAGGCERKLWLLRHEGVLIP